METGAISKVSRAPKRVALVERLAGTVVPVRGSRGSLVGDRAPV